MLPLEALFPVRSDQLQIGGAALKDKLAGMLKIDCDPSADVRLDLPKPPVGARAAADDGAGLIGSGSGHPARRSSPGEGR